MPANPDYSGFQVGETQFPLTSALTNSLLADADPALYQLAEFLKYCLNTYVGARLLAAASAAGVTLPAGSACKTYYPYEPTPQFLEEQLQLPALFVFRTRGATEQWTSGHEHDLWGVSVVYLLPPLDAAGSEALVPILRAVYSTIRRKVTDSWDPGYTPPGGTAGQQWTQLASVEEVGFGPPADKRVVSVETGYEIGHLPGTGDLWFPALMMRGFLTERDEAFTQVGGPDKWAGGDITLNVRAPDGTVVAASSSGVVRVSTGLPPTITSLSVSTGPVAGGTSITVTGTGFLTGPPLCYFGPADDPQYAASVTYNSATSLTVVTPPVANAGLYDFTIENRDGQSVTSAGAFTFT